MVDNATGRATLYGASYSVYVRIARVILEEIGIPYQLVEVDIFKPSTVPTDYRQRHPFAKIPSFEHEGLRLFETDAIARYAVALSRAHHLLLETPQQQARVIQIMRIADHYAYPRLVWGVFVEETDHGRAGELTDEEVGRAHTVLTVLAGFLEEPFFMGERLSLADLWAAPMMVLLRLVPTGRALLSEFPSLKRWLRVVQGRASMQATRFPLEGSPT
jgi:glutathione S-transferase